MQNPGLGYDENTIFSAQNVDMSPCKDVTLNRILEFDKPKIRPNGLLAKLAVPCQIDSDYDYGLCYSYYANGCYNTCQFVAVGDIEDFM